MLGPIADSYEADLYLPTGSLSDTLIYQMAKIGADDGRPMVVLYFSDCDPSGWNMPIEVGRKLQAFKVLPFPDWSSKSIGSRSPPTRSASTTCHQPPLKDTEKRGDKWQAAMGVEQTEIDALASLRPDLLRQIARDAIAPFYDFDLDRRVLEARQDWIDRAQSRSSTTAWTPSSWTGSAPKQTEKLAAMREQIDELNEQLQIDVDDFDLPAIEVPDAHIDYDVQPMPLLDSSWSFAEQCKALIDSKAYRLGGGS